MTGADRMRRRLGYALIAVVVTLVGCTSAPYGVDAATVSVPRIAGCALFPSTNPCPTDISHPALPPRSAAGVRSIGPTVHLPPAFGPAPSYGIPYPVVPADQRKVP